jgi:hypothetical protein
MAMVLPPNPHLLVAVRELAVAVDENGGESCNRERELSEREREPPPGLDFENIPSLSLSLGNR